MLKLQFKDQRKPAIWLVETRYALGKDPQNAIVLADDGVSPFHAEFRIEGDQVFISDTGSTNGTFVNGKRIQRRTELRPQDVIRLHTVELLLIDPKQAVAPPPDGATAISPAVTGIPAASGARQGSGWSLKAKTGSIVGQTFAVPSVGKLVVGRAANCDVQLPANHVSRQHAEVQVSGGKLLVRDLNSSNGTFVNRKKVSEAELKPGDEVRFDTFSFDVIGQAAAAAAVADDGAGKTEFRQAITPEALAAASRAKPAKAHSLTSTTRLAPVVDDGKPAAAAGKPAAGGGGTVIAVVAALVVIGGALAFFVLK